MSETSNRSSMLHRFRRWRIRRAKFALADADWMLTSWGDHPGTSPSEREAMQRKVDKCRARLRRRQLAAGVKPHVG